MSGGITPRQRGSRVTPVADRILAKVESDPDTLCWTFTGSKNHGGYGLIWGGPDRPGMKATHRLMYESRVGPIPDGLDLDHLCRNRACCNPAHLEPVTRSENLRRGIGGALLAARNLSKTRCPEGHPYDESNTKLRSNGHRTCRRCQSHEYRLIRAARKKASR